MFAGGQKYDISVAASSTLRDLFDAVSRATDVEPKSLKIIHRGKSLSYDETSLADVRMTNGAKLMALGRKVCNIRTPPWSVVHTYHNRSTCAQVQDICNHGVRCLCIHVAKFNVCSLSQLPDTYACKLRGNLLVRKCGAVYVHCTEQLEFTVYGIWC